MVLGDSKLEKIDEDSHSIRILKGTILPILL
jgi:hypothetical protein